MASHDHHGQVGETQDQTGNARRRPDWRIRLSGLLLGTVGGGLTINVLSNDYRWQAVAVATLLGAVGATASWLRRRPGAPIVRWTSRLLLMIAVVAAILSFAVPATWLPWPVAAAAALTIGAALIPTDPLTAKYLLFGAASVGVGVAMAGAGLHLLTNVVPNHDGVTATFNSNPLFGSALVVGGVAAIGYGIGLYTDSTTILGAALVGAGPACGAYGIGLFLAGGSLLAMGMVSVGVACIGYGIGFLTGSELVRGTALVVGGVACIGVGVGLLNSGALLEAAVGTGFSLLTGDSPLPGVAFVGIGLAVVGAGVGLVRGSGPMIAVGLVCGGVGLLSLGIGSLGRGPDILLGSALIGVGVAVIGLGADFVPHGTRARVRAWWAAATAESASTVVPSVTDGPDDHQTAADTNIEP